MASYEPQDPDFEARVRASFDRQDFMHFLGATLVEIVPGRCSIELPARKELSQQHGFVHAGAVTTIADSAAGYAAYSLMPADSSVLTVELKINLMAPAKGERLRATGQVTRAGEDAQRRQCRGGGVR